MSYPKRFKTVCFDLLVELPIGADDHQEQKLICDSIAGQLRALHGRSQVSVIVRNDVVSFVNQASRPGPKPNSQNYQKFPWWRSAVAKVLRADRSALKG